MIDRNDLSVDNIFVGKALHSERADAKVVEKKTESHYIENCWRFDI